MGRVRERILIVDERCGSTHNETVVQDGDKVEGRVRVHGWGLLGNEIRGQAGE